MNNDQKIEMYIKKWKRYLKDYSYNIFHGREDKYKLKRLVEWFESEDPINEFDQNIDELMELNYDYVHELFDIKLNEWLKDDKIDIDKDIILNDIDDNFFHIFQDHINYNIEYLFENYDILLLGDSYGIEFNVGRNKEITNVIEDSEYVSFRKESLKYITAKAFDNFLKKSESNSIECIFGIVIGVKDLIKLFYKGVDSITDYPVIIIIDYGIYADIIDTTKERKKTLKLKDITIDYGYSLNSIGDNLETNNWKWSD